MIRQLPNALTLLRLLSAPILAASLLSGRPVLALLIFAFAGVSDVADGFVAKKYGLATAAGRYLDPAADKVLMLASFLALTATGTAPPWLTVVVIGRDASIVLAIFLARSLELPLRVEPLAIGKLCTAVQVAYVALMLVLLTLGLKEDAVANGTAIVAAAVTIASWIAYAGLWLKALAARYRSVT